MLTSSAFTTDSDIARAEFEAHFDAAFAILAGEDDCADAFLSHVSEAYYADGRTVEDWTAEELAEAYRNISTSLRSDFMDAERGTLASVCTERAEWATSNRDAETGEERTPAETAGAIVATFTNEADELAATVYASAATYRVHGRAPHERFDPKTTPIMAEGLTFKQAGEVASRLRAQHPGLVFTVSAAGLASQINAAAEAIAEGRAEVSRKGRARRAELDAPACVPGDSDGAPLLAREDALRADEADVYAHVSGSGSRFDVRRKLAEAFAFTWGRGGASLAIPSKLRGTAGLAERTARLAADVDVWDGGGSVYLPTVLHVLPEGMENGPGVAVLAAPHGTRDGAYIVGYLQDKHARWLAPLLNPTAAGTVTEESTPVRVYVTAVTGGTEDKPTRGVNVCITGAADAVRSMWHETASEEARADAYESGDPARIEALLD